MNRKNAIIRGTFLLTFAGIITKIIGFYYRVFLNKQIGAKGLGLYQLVFPVFIMGFAFCCIGIQTSMSRMIAENINNDKLCMKILITSTFYSVVLSCVVWWFCYYKSEFIAIQFLKNEKCSDLVKILGFSFVPASVHSCISGYYYGLKKTGLPAASQLLEQVSRVIIVYFMLKLPENKLDTVMWGLVLGEAFGALVSVTYLLFERMIKKYNSKNINKSEVSGRCNAKNITHSNISGRCNAKNITHSKVSGKYSVNNNVIKKESVFRHKKGIVRLTCELFSQAVPLTLNRIGTNFLQSVEAVLFPILLCKFGYSNDDSLMYFGILTGIAMPLIMFPSALTNSLSVLLLSDVAELNSNDDNKKIKATTECTIEYTVLLGIYCLGMFFIAGNDIGTIVFSSDTAGYYIKLIAFLCPFIYLPSVLKSVLYGLGKTMEFFVCNIVILVTRLILMWLFMPVYGVNGYVFILLIGQIAMTVFILCQLKRANGICFDFSKWIISPSICVLTAYALTKITWSIVDIMCADSCNKIITAGLLNPAVKLAVNCFLYSMPFMIYSKKVYRLIKSGKNQ